MLAYAAERPKTASRTGSPGTLALILAGHAAIVVAVLAATPEIIRPPFDRPPVVVNIPVPLPQRPVPEADPQERRPVTQPWFIDQERPMIEMERQDPIDFGGGPSFEDIGTVIGSGPTMVDPPDHAAVRIAARWATPESAVKPPYPADMRRLEKEATLRLKLTIDPRGRVIAVDALGPAEPSFLEAARRHILKAWRYQPATEDGVAVSSTTMVSLSFRLEDM